MKRETMPAQGATRPTHEITLAELLARLDANSEPMHRSEAVDLAIECLAGLIVRARHVQRCYFEARDRGLLVEAQRLERRLDLIAEAVLRTSSHVAERSVFVEEGSKAADLAVATILGGDQTAPRAAG